MQVVYVALGSALGGTIRFALSSLCATSSGFPWATLTVNVVGSLAIGALSGWLAQGGDHAAAIRGFGIIGFCGGFTTFSTFSSDAFRLIGNSQWGMLAAYALISVGVGIAAVALGEHLVG